MHNVRKKGRCGQGALEEREVQGDEAVGVARGQRALEASRGKEFIFCPEHNGKPLKGLRGV